MNKVFVYIDGRNFYYRLKDFGETDFNFNFEKFSKLISGNKANRKVKKIYYYNSSLKQQINPLLFIKQQKLFARLRSNPLIELRLCKRQWRSGFTGGQVLGKTVGDDVWLTCDMLQDANDNKFDVAILVSCDGDYIYLVDYVQKLRKKVENAYFVGSGSRAVKKKCNAVIPIDLSLIRECQI